MREMSAFGFRKWVLLTLLAASGTAPLAFSLASRAEAEELAGPSMNDRRIARLVANLMPRRHISGEPLGDEHSQRALELFLKSLDPMKLYFTKADVDEFAQHRTQLDDMVREGDVTFAYTVFHRFLQRVDERLGMVEALLKEPFDFAADESIVIDPDVARYPINDEEARERWRRQLKYSLLVLEEDGKSREEALEQLDRRYHRNARRWHQIDDDKLLELFLTSITSSYDPHTTYMSPKTLDNFNITMRLNLEGIGAALQEKDGSTVVSKVIPGGAADKQGELRADDHIVSVAQGDDGEMVDIIEMPLDDVVDLIRGDAGSVVRLGVKSGGVGETKELRIVRAKVELEDSAARGEIVPVETKEDGEPMQIGYINLPSFYMDMEGARSNRPDFRSSTRDVARILGEFREKNVDAVVLDLSANGGGSLTEAINLTGLFIDRGPVVQVKDSAGSVEAYADEDSGVAWDGPLVVVTSKFSASASEILAGAIKDYRRGLVVGDPMTHGKGTVQTLLDLDREILLGNGNKMGALKVTLQQFYLPDGESTQREGVKADVILPSLSTHMDIGEADLQYALPSDRVPPAPHHIYRMVPADVLGTVRARSSERIKNHKEFVDLMRRIDSYRRQKEEKFLSLNREEFLETRKELDAQKEDEKELLDQQISDDEVFSDTFYNNEVMSITVDYLEGLRQQNLAKAG
ncbi:carboxy terminal-processing peptidase [Candidatus Laterigemmans baculatus]|uniref:carboxy terminal-processing peptidase n=1 Tax=Candidatus Laterigemmans baculatus TaxID=2770505 RepID=UPI0013DD0ED9|nr:carboxy terminal-processing peptidase [Candidatus Laterigemmans baculatus]